MNGISPISGIGAATAASLPTAPAARIPNAGGTSFSEMLHSVAQQSATLDANAARAVTGLLSGDGTDVHEAMIATQKADIAFEMALQVRNRAVSAYQQMMQMQF